jgi:hypothetical protein
VNGTFVDNLTKLIMDALLQYGGLLELNLELKLCVLVQMVSQSFKVLNWMLLCN